MESGISHYLQTTGMQPRLSEGAVQDLECPLSVEEFTLALKAIKTI